MELNVATVLVEPHAPLRNCFALIPLSCAQASATRPVLPAADRSHARALVIVVAVAQVWP